MKKNLLLCICMIITSAVALPLMVNGQNNRSPFQISSGLFNINGTMNQSENGRNFPFSFNKDDKKLNLPTRTANYDELLEKARANDKVRVIIGLNADFSPEGNLTNQQRSVQHSTIAQAQSNLLSQLKNFDAKVTAQFKFIPFIAMIVDESTLKFLKASPQVSHISEDGLNEPTLAQSVPLIQTPAAWNLGYTGAGQTIAILDTGVDKAHSFLSGKVVSEACYSTNDFELEPDKYYSLCPGGVTESTAPDSGLPCNLGCSHGTHVAGIAAGKGTSFSGVAKDSNLISIMVFTKREYTPPDGTPNRPNNVGNGEEPIDPLPRISLVAFDSDIIKGLERVLVLKNTTQSGIASVNMSLGGGLGSGVDCGNGGPMATAISNLFSVKVATVVSSGNDSFTNRISFPACVEPAISVGSTSDTSTAIASTSNSGQNLDLLAPGVSITSSVPSGGFGDKSGTSMAAPHVAGAWAILKQKNRNATVAQILNIFQTTGLPITDPRNQITRRRILVGPAVQALPAGNKPFFDYTGDGQTDISVYRNGTWFIRNNQGGYSTVAFGNSTDRIAPADYDGDGKTDIAVFRPNQSTQQGEWHILRSSDNGYSVTGFGLPSDTIAPADYDADGKADLAVFRSSSSTWYIYKSSTNSVATFQFGLSSDIPVKGDFNGDGTDDVSVFRPSNGTWYRRNSLTDNGYSSVQFGLNGDKPVPADYDGDGKIDIAVFRPSDLTWYLLRSNLGYQAVQFGSAGDILVPGKYNGDNSADIAIFRPNEGNWYIYNYTIVNFGQNGDKPTPSAFIP